MRRAKSYSIVDHEILHSGFFQKLSVDALAFYLFLVVVGDQEGRSYYAERTIMSILRIDGQRFVAARDELVQSGLIRNCSPYFWVLNLTSPPQMKYAKQSRFPGPCGVT